MDQIVLRIPTHLISMDKAFVFESPDGGHSIYRRPMGQIGPRELVSISPELQEKQELETLWMRWIPILRDSRDDPILKGMLDQAMIYHSLKDSP